MKIEKINPDTVFEPQAPYSQLVKADLGNAELLTLAGQVGFDKNGKLSEDPKEQLEQTFKNIQGILESEGCSFADVIQLRFYLTDREYRVQLHEVGAYYFAEHKPATTLLVISSLARPEIKVEIEAIAIKYK